ncbi:MAG: hypothetical protein M1835_003365, partial [Candelina submexicana]
LPASPERSSPQPTANYCPDEQQKSRPQNLPERLRFAGETSKHPCSPDLPVLGVRTSLKVNGRLGSPHVRRTFTPMGFGSDDGSSSSTADPLLAKSMQFAGTARLSSPAEHSSSAEAKAAITGPAWLDYLNLDYLNNVKLSGEIREKFMKYPTFHAAIGLLSHHTNQLLAHVNGFEISNAHLHAAAAGDFTNYVEHLETSAIQESIIRHCFRPIVQVSISNWQLLIDHVQGAIQLDWVSGVGKERNGKRFFAMLTGPDYEYSEGWQQYDVVAVKQSLNEEEWDQVLEWLDAKSDIFLACTRRLENLKVPKRATVFKAKGKYLILEASKPTGSTTEEVGLRSKLPIGAMPEDESSRKYIMSDNVIAFANVQDEASDAELDKEDELASVDHISWINNN